MDPDRRASNKLNITRNDPNPCLYYNTKKGSNKILPTSFQSLTYLYKCQAVKLLINYNSLRKIKVIYLHLAPEYIFRHQNKTKIFTPSQGVGCHWHCTVQSYKLETLHDLRFSKNKNQIIFIINLDNMSLRTIQPLK